MATPTRSAERFAAGTGGERTLRWVVLLMVLLAAGTAGAMRVAHSGPRPTKDEDRAARRGGASEVDVSVNDDAKANETANSPRQTKPPTNPFPDRPKVPEGILDGGKAWLNTSGPISIKDLKGKIVLLDFWTYCCINCMHVLPDLKYFEQKYPKQVVVIGVHSAKFDNEKDSENIRRAIMRYEIEHPVVNDADMVIWRNFGAQAWPTLVMLDPEGHYLGSISGEGHREVLETIIGKLIEYHRAKGTLDETPVRFDLESAKLAPTPLRFPGKVLADEAGNRLFISDTNHNRIVVTTLDGKLLEVIGSGAVGPKDGGFAEAEFDHPHGMALVEETLYVADTENHLIRAIDLRGKEVSTLAGTGEQTRRRALSGRLRETALSSPWALAHLDGVLYVAMAGPHQIWRHKLGSEGISVFAGSGREDIIDGPLRQAALAQPSGIVTDGKVLYFVDSEGSSVRRATTGPEGVVRTLIGPWDVPFGRLFEFGDVDGVGSKARLQHPIGIANDGQTLYVADTYNHKIKRVDRTRAGWRVTSILGTGERGDGLDPPQFFEPEGLSLANGKLYIADTNNHRICLADPATGNVKVLNIPGLEPPKRVQAKPADLASSSKPQTVPPQTLAAGDTLRFEVEMKFPEGFKPNKLAPVIYRLTAAGEQNLIAEEQLDVRRKADVEGSTAVIDVPLASKTGDASLELMLVFTYCRDGVGGLCKLKTARWQIPVAMTADGKQTSVKLVADARK